MQKLPSELYTREYMYTRAQPDLTKNRQTKDFQKMTIADDTFVVEVKWEILCRKEKLELWPASTNL